MRKNILLIVLVAAIFVFVGAMSNSAKAAEDPVDLIRNAKTPVHLHSLAGGDSLVHDLPTMVCTYWHSIYPPSTFCHVWHVIDERDNGIFGLNPSDKLKIEHVPDGSPIWIHVEDVTVTLRLQKSPAETMYVEYSGGVDPDSVDRVVYDPVCTFWHEVRPEFCRWWHINEWTDNGNGKLDSCDNIGIKPVEVWHVIKVDSLTTGFFLKLKNPSNPIDTMRVKFSAVPPHPDSVLRARQTPVCTWWHEEWPQFSQWWHIVGWDDNGNHFLDSCDYIGIVNPADEEWWHVEDIATDILVQSIPDPTVPTMTQWGVIVLAALIVASAIFIMLRRRRVTVPA